MMERMGNSEFHNMRNLAELPDQFIDTYLSNCQKKTANKREILFGPNEAPDYIYLVLQGKVRIFLSYPNGKEFTITILEHGGVYSGHARGFGMAMTPKTEIVLIHVNLFRKIMEDNPTFMLSVMAILGNALKNTVNIIENLAFREVDGRLMHYLSQTIKRCGLETSDGILIDIGFTQEEIATTIGSTRQTVSSQLKQLENKGVIRMQNRKITILKPEYIFESTNDI